MPTTIAPTTRHAARGRATFQALRRGRFWAGLSAVGAFALSGLVAGSDLLDKDIKSLTPLYLFHGKEDMKVQYKTLSDSVNWLQKHGVNVQVQTYSDLAHKISEEEINEVAEIINK